MDPMQAADLVLRLGEYFPKLNLPANSQKLWAEEIAPFDYATGANVIKQIANDPELRGSPSLGRVTGAMRAAGGGLRREIPTGTDESLVLRMMPVVERDMHDSAEMRGCGYHDLLREAATYWQSESEWYAEIGLAEQSYLARHRAMAAERLVR